MKPAHKMLLQWVLLILMFLAIWKYMAPESPAPPRATSSGGSSIFSVGVIFALLIPTFLLLRRVLGSSAKVVQAMGEAQGFIQQGRLDDAERSLEGLEKINRLAVNRIAVGVVHATIHFQRGNVEEALRYADTVLSARLPIVWRTLARRNELLARGLRAVLHAAQGDATAARADIARIRSSPEAIAEARARAELAELLLLERTGDRAAWMAHLDRTRTLLLEGTGAQERAIVRAFECMVSSPGAPVYRRKAVVDAEASSKDVLPMAEWVARFAPAAAPFVVVPARTAWGRAAAKELENAMLDGLSEAAQRSVDAAHAPDKRVRLTAGRSTLVVLWVGLIGVFLAVWTFMGGVITMARVWVFLAAIGAAVIGCLVWFVSRISRNRRRWRALFAASVSISEGKLDRAEQSLVPLSRVADHDLAGNAELLLAEIAHRRTEFSSSLEHCDRGLQHVAAIRLAAQKAGNTEHIPRAVGSLDYELTALRAFVLAVLHREPEALAELQRISAETAPLAHLRVRMLLLMRRGALAEAAQCMDCFPGLCRRDEMLAEVIRHAATPASNRNDADVDRMRAELRRDALLEQWIARVAPHAHAAVWQAHAGAG